MQNKKTKKAKITEVTEELNIQDVATDISSVQSETEQPSRQLEPVIIGAGGFAREVQAEVYKQYGNSLKMYVNDEYWVEGLYKISEFDHKSQSALIAVGSPADKKMLLSKLPENTNFWNYISPNAYVNNLTLGVGNFICAGVIITTNVTIGNHVHLNLQTTIGHDSVIGDFVTTAPSVNISGNVKIGNGVYLGTKSCIREKISICDDVVLGLNAGVVSDIEEIGVYVGTPAKKIK
jgi:sugar O-acyltransferase (sialic acid O-acetyltransferase NeuD family)